MTGRKKLLAVVLLLAVIWVGWQIMRQDGQARQEPRDTASGESLERTGQNSQGAAAAPDFTLRDTGGREVRLSDLRGKKVLVNFWTTWCGYCKEEMPLLQKFHDENGGGSWRVLTINITSSEKSVSQVLDYIKSNNYTFPVLLDEKGSVASLYRVSSIPASFILNEKGEVIKTKIGAFTAKEIADLGRQ